MPGVVKGDDPPPGGVAWPRRGSSGGVTFAWEFQLDRWLVLGVMMNYSHGIEYRKYFENLCQSGSSVRHTEKIPWVSGLTQDHPSMFTWTFSESACIWSRWDEEGQLWNGRITTPLTFTNTYKEVYIRRIIIRTNVISTKYYVIYLPHILGFSHIVSEQICINLNVNVLFHRSSKTTAIYILK